MNVVKVIYLMKNEKKKGKSITEENISELNRVPNIQKNGLPTNFGKINESDSHLETLLRKYGLLTT